MADEVDLALFGAVPEPAFFANAVLARPNTVTAPGPGMRLVSSPVDHLTRSMCRSAPSRRPHEATDGSADGPLNWSRTARTGRPRLPLVPLGSVVRFRRTELPEDSGRDGYTG